MATVKSILVVHPKHGELISETFFGWGSTQDFFKNVTHRSGAWK